MNQGKNLNKCPACRKEDTLYVRSGAFFVAGVALDMERRQAPLLAHCSTICKEEDAMLAGCEAIACTKHSTDLSKCPSCGAEDALSVRAGLFFASGVHLQPDGSYKLEDKKRWGPANEIVECCVCGRDFALVKCGNKTTLRPCENGDTALRPLEPELEYVCGDSKLVVAYSPCGRVFRFVSPERTTEAVLERKEIVRLITYLLRAL